MRTLDSKSTIHCCQMTNFVDGPSHWRSLDGQHHLTTRNPRYRTVTAELSKPSQDHLEQRNRIRTSLKWSWKQSVRGILQTSRNLLALAYGPITLLERVLWVTFWRPVMYRPRMGIVKTRKLSARPKIILFSKTVQDYGNRPADICLVMQAVGPAGHSQFMW